MKFLPLLFFLILLTACGPATPSPDDLRRTATWQVYNNDVATIIAGTATARAPTETPIPPPKLLPLSELILSEGELADIGTWADYYTINPDKYGELIDYLNWESKEYCPRACFGRIWSHEVGYIGVSVVISSFYTEDMTLTAFQKIVESPIESMQKVSESPDLVGFPLPDDTLIIKHEQNWVTVIARQETFIVFSGVYMPDKSQLENIYSAAVITDRQLNKLDNPFQ